MQTFFKIALVHTTGGSNKFWNASIGIDKDREGGNQPAYLARYGKIGTTGSVNPQAKGSHMANWEFLKKKVQEKLKKGYVFDSRNTSNHFVRPEILLDGKRPSKSESKRIENLSRSVVGYCKRNFEHPVTVICKGPDDIREVTKEEMKGPEPVRKGLKTMMNQRKKEAKFQL